MADYYEFDVSSSEKKASESTSPQVEEEEVYWNDPLLTRLTEGLSVLFGRLFDMEKAKILISTGWEGLCSLVDIQSRDDGESLFHALAILLLLTIFSVSFFRGCRRVWSHFNRESGVKMVEINRDAKNEEIVIVPQRRFDAEELDSSLTPVARVRTRIKEVETRCQQMTHNLTHIQNSTETAIQMMLLTNQEIVTQLLPQLTNALSSIHLQIPIQHDETQTSIQGQELGQNGQEQFVPHESKRPEVDLTEVVVGNISEDEDDDYDYDEDEDEDSVSDASENLDIDEDEDDIDPYDGYLICRPNAAAAEQQHRLQQPLPLYQQQQQQHHQQHQQRKHQSDGRDAGLWMNDDSIASADSADSFPIISEWTELDCVGADASTAAAVEDAAAVAAAEDTAAAAVAEHATAADAAEDAAAEAAVEYATAVDAAAAAVAEHATAADEAEAAAEDATAVDAAAMDTTAADAAAGEESLATEEIVEKGVKAGYQLADEENPKYQDWTEEINSVGEISGNDAQIIGTVCVNTVAQVEAENAAMKANDAVAVESMAIASNKRRKSKKSITFEAPEVSRAAAEASPCLDSPKLDIPPTPMATYSPSRDSPLGNSENSEREFPFSSVRRNPATRGEREGGEEEVREEEARGERESAESEEGEKEKGAADEKEKESARAGPKSKTKNGKCVSFSGVIENIYDVDRRKIGVPVLPSRVTSDGEGMEDEEEDEVPAENTPAREALNAFGPTAEEDREEAIGENAEAARIKPANDSFSLFEELRPKRPSEKDDWKPTLVTRDAVTKCENTETAGISSEATLLAGNIPDEASPDTSCGSPDSSPDPNLPEEIIDGGNDDCGNGGGDLFRSHLESVHSSIDESAFPSIDADDHHDEASVLNLMVLRGEGASVDTDCAFHSMEDVPSEGVLSTSIKTEEVTLRNVESNKEETDSVQTPLEELPASFHFDTSLTSDNFPWRGMALDSLAESEAKLSTEVSAALAVDEAVGESLTPSVGAENVSALVEPLNEGGPPMPTSTKKSSQKKGYPKPETRKKRPRKE